MPNVLDFSNLQHHYHSSSHSPAPQPTSQRPLLVWLPVYRNTANAVRSPGARLFPFSSSSYRGFSLFVVSPWALGLALLPSVLWGNCHGCHGTSTVRR